MVQSIPVGRVINDPGFLATQEKFASSKGISAHDTEPSEDRNRTNFQPV